MRWLRPPESEPEAPPASVAGASDGLDAFLSSALALPVGVLGIALLVLVAGAVRKGLRSPRGRGGSLEIGFGDGGDGD